MAAGPANLHMIKRALTSAQAFVDSSPRAFLILLSLLIFWPGATTLPPLDRDEARYAQASKQMLETGDFIEIKFQDRGRNKKPAGVYWLQAASASLFGGPEKASIAAYRWPSALSALLTVLFVHGLAARHLSSRGALSAGALMASTLLLVGEATIAKTDAALLAAITGAAFAAYVIYDLTQKKKEVRAKWSLFFWLALGIGTLVKGPVVLMVLGLTLLALTLADRNLSWLKSFRPLMGVPIYLLLVLPWGIAIWQATDGAFFAEALGKDFGPKLVSGQESHGAPPGYFLMLVSLTLWPAALFLWPSLLSAWQNKTDPLVRFCLAWAIPSWLVFELIPTKLPHYILPVYPALILISVAAIEHWRKKPADLNKPLMIVSMLIWSVATFALLAVIAWGPGEYGGALTPAIIISIVLAAVAALFALWAFFKQNWNRALIACVLTGLMFTWGFLQGAATQIPDLFVSPKVARALKDVPSSAPLASAGFTEPSLVFLTRTDIELGNGNTAAQFLANHPKGIAIVESRESNTFLAKMADQGLTPWPIAKIEGTNYSRGDEVTLTLYRLQPSMISGQ